MEYGNHLLLLLLMTKMMMIFGVDFVLVVFVVELGLICSMPIVWVFVIFSVVLALV